MHLITLTTQGPCCTDECSLKSGDQCREDNGCRDVSFCDGLAPACPLSALKPNKTVCNKEFVCYKGVSSGKRYSVIKTTQNSAIKKAKVSQYLQAPVGHDANFIRICKRVWEEGWGTGRGNCAHFCRRN